MSGVIEKSADGSANSLRIAVQQRTRHAAAWQVRNRAQLSLSTRKKGTASRAVFRVNAAASPSSGKAGASPPPDDAGNRRRHRNRRRDEHNRPAENEQSRRERATRREGNNRRRSPGRASGHVPQDSPRDFAQTNTTRPALSFPGTGAPPRAQKRRSAKPKFCRTPDRHDSGLARSLNRTFSYRMKLVRMTGSFSGSGTPAALPASKQRSIHAMFLAS